MSQNVNLSNLRAVSNFMNELRYGMHHHLNKTSYEEVLMLHSYQRPLANKIHQI